MVNEVNANVGMKLDGTAIKLEAPLSGVVLCVLAEILHTMVIINKFLS